MTSPGADSIHFRDALRVWVRVALQSFGGPAGQIAVMHRILVEEKGWIGEARFLHALNYCMLLPGPEAQQLATYIGWLLHRTKGGLAAGILFILPGFVSILTLSILYAGFRDLGVVAALFYGLKPAVMAVVVEAVVRIGRRALATPFAVGIAAAAFLAIFFLEVPFPAIVAAAGVAGWLGGWLFPGPVPDAAGGAGAPGEADAAGDGREGVRLHHEPPSLRRSLRVLAVCLGLWLVPIALLAAFLGPGHVLVDQAVFFSKTAMVTFGGAYAVLAYVGQQAVETFHWLQPGEMLDGLGLAETTPGPLIMVLPFVGFLGAFRLAEGMNPWAAGVLGAAVTTWVTFVPCFLWIFLGAPYIEALRGNRALSRALAGITAAVVGVILNLAAWFSLHTLFATVEEVHVSRLRLLVPAWSTLDPAAVALSLLAFLALFRFKLGMPKTLALSAAAGLLLHLAGWR